MVFKKRLVKIVYLMYTNYCMFNVVSYYSIDLIYCFNSVFNVHTDFRFWIPVVSEKPCKGRFNKTYVLMYVRYDQWCAHNNREACNLICKNL